MPEDMYDDGGDTAVETPPAETEKEESTDKEGAATATLPREFFGDKTLEPGKRCEVEIQRVMDDQVLVSKVPESEYGKGKEEVAEAPESSGTDDMME